MVWNGDPLTFNSGNVSDFELLLGPAERADVIVDFSAYAGKTLILYNDAPAAFPALDPSNDYYTGNPDQFDTGGTGSTLPGFGPNTRTIMQIRVTNAPGAFDVAALMTAWMPGSPRSAGPASSSTARTRSSWGRGLAYCRVPRVHGVYTNNPAFPSTPRGASAPSSPTS